MKRLGQAFQVLECVGDMRSRALIRFVRRVHRPGIVYCTTTREVDSVYLVMRQLDIPADLAYGENPGGGRPGGTLVFDIELLRILD